MSPVLSYCTGLYLELHVVQGVGERAPHEELHGEVVHALWVLRVESSGLGFGV